MKKRCFVVLLSIALLTVVLVGCQSERPLLTLAPLQEPEKLSQVLDAYNAIVNEAINFDKTADTVYPRILFGENVTYDHLTSALLDKLQELELEPDYSDPILEGEGYPIIFTYRLGQIKLGVMNEEQIDIYYYNTAEDNGTPRYRLKILNREVGKELCEIAKNFHEWEKSLDG